MRYLKFNLKYNQLNEQCVNVICDYKASYWQDCCLLCTDDNKCILKPYNVEVFPFTFVYENKNGRLYEGYYSIEGNNFYISHTKSSLSYLKNITFINKGTKHE